MKSNEFIFKKIISKLRASKGMRFQEILDLCEPIYFYLDYNLDHFVKNCMQTLVKWGLIEAYYNKEKVNDISKHLYETIFYISEQMIEIEETLGIFLDSSISTTFLNHRDYASEVLRNDIFVLMPFENEMKPIYEDHLKIVANELNLSIARADDFFTTNNIVSDIWQAIYKSKIIIADCTNRNPNVFYELGLAHAMGKETIIITQKLEDIPVDLRHLRIIEYNYTPRGMKSFNENLKKTLINAIRNIDFYGGYFKNYTK